MDIHRLPFPFADSVSFLFTAEKSHVPNKENLYNYTKFDKAFLALPFPLPIQSSSIYPVLSYPGFTPWFVRRRLDTLYSQQGRTGMWAICGDTISFANPLYLWKVLIYALSFFLHPLKNPLSGYRPVTMSAATRPQRTYAEPWYNLQLYLCEAMPAPLSIHSSAPRGPYFTKGNREEYLLSSEPDSRYKLRNVTKYKVDIMHKRLLECEYHDSLFSTILKLPFESARKAYRRSQSSMLKVLGYSSETPTSV